MRRSFFSGKLAWLSVGIREERWRIRCFPGQSQAVKMVWSPLRLHREFYLICPSDFIVNFMPQTSYISVWAIRVLHPKFYPVVNDLPLNFCFLQPFVKVIKNKAYFKRYQVKFKRRRGMYTQVLEYRVIITWWLLCRGQNRLPCPQAPSDSGQEQV